MDNGLIPLLPAYRQERSRCRGSRDSIALPEGAFSPDKRAGEFLTVFRETEGAGRGSPTAAGGAQPSSQVAPWDEG